MLLFGGSPFVKDHLVILPKHKHFLTVPEWILAQLVGSRVQRIQSLSLRSSVLTQFPVIVAPERQVAPRLLASFF